MPARRVVVAPSGSGRTCGRGSGRSRASARGTPGRRVSICSSTMSSSIFALVGLGQHLRARAPGSPVAISRSCRGRRRRRRAAGRRRAARGRTGRTACLVERVDDVVAVAPGVAVTATFSSQPVGVGVAGHVEPVPAPPLAVVRRRQQPVDHLREGVRATSSARNASTSSGVGGRPVRSNVTRRISVARSAVGAPAAGPSASSRARMNRSMGARRPGGVAAPPGRRAGRRAGTPRTPRPASTRSPAALRRSAAAPCGPRGAELHPRARGRRSSASGSLPLGGICRSSP